MKERRKGERRSWGPEPTYPFVDSNGITVTNNRRRTVDRRWSDNSDSEPQIQYKQLRLCLQDLTEVLSESKPALLAGRCPPCQLIVDKRFVSRRHAQIKYRNGSFILVDQSTNGTYLRDDQGEELHLVGDETQLKGSGLISMGRPIVSGDEYLIQFHCE
jgi:pSer/pThr/pTyr-binding forkhead associated (FHA) protein